MDGLQRLASEEIGVLAQLHRPAEPGLERRVVRRDVGTPGAVALFQPQRFQRAIADRPDAECGLPAAISASNTSPVAAIGTCNSQPSSPT